MDPFISIVVDDASVPAGKDSYSRYLRWVEVNYGPKVRGMCDEYLQKEIGNGNSPNPALWLEHLLEAHRPKVPAKAGAVKFIW